MGLLKSKNKAPVELPPPAPKPIKFVRGVEAEELNRTSVTRPIQPGQYPELERLPNGDLYYKSHYHYGTTTAARQQPAPVSYSNRPIKTQAPPPPSSPLPPAIVTNGNGINRSNTGSILSPKQDSSVKKRVVDLSCVHITHGFSWEVIKKIFKTGRRENGGVFELGVCESYHGVSDVGPIRLCLNCGYQGCETHAAQHVAIGIHHALTLDLKSWEIWCSSCKALVVPRVNNDLIDCVSFIKQQSVVKSKSGTDVKPTPVFARQDSLSLYPTIKRESVEKSNQLDRLKILENSFSFSNGNYPEEHSLSVKPTPKFVLQDSFSRYPAIKPESAGASNPSAGVLNLNSSLSFSNENYAAKTFYNSNFSNGVIKNGTQEMSEASKTAGNRESRFGFQPPPPFSKTSSSSPVSFSAAKKSSFSRQISEDRIKAAEDEDRERSEYLGNGVDTNAEVSDKKLDWWEMTLDPDYVERQDVDPENPYLGPSVADNTSGSKSTATRSRSASADRRRKPGNSKSQNQAEKKFRISPISSQILSKASKSSPRVAVLMLLDPKNGLALRLKENECNKDILQQIIYILGNISSYKDYPRNTTALLKQMMCTKLFEKLIPIYLSLSLSKNETPELIRVLGHLLAFLERIFTIPLRRKDTKLLESTITVCLFVVDNINDDCPTDFDARFKELQRKCEEVNEKQPSYTTMHKAVSDVDVPPPDDFRQLPVTPLSQELEADFVPFLRKNLDVGKFSDVDHYLDIQFRLMREDFINPLREGIDDHKSQSRRKTKPQDMLKINIYHRVRVVGVMCSPSDGVVTRLEFDVGRLRDVKWENTRRFMCGSLLVLSDDNFRTFVLATVVFTPPKQMSQGRVLAKAILGEDFLWNVTSSRTFIMAESPAFFGAYAPVMQALQDFTEMSLPFQRQIVDVEVEVSPPKYLNRGAMYNFGPVFDLAGEPPLLPCEVLSPEKWPSPEQLHLDLDQYKAFKLALTKEVALIQGPPGTGKTFIGLKIVQALLVNSLVWNHTEAPILVVCFTNHALDQFLEGIIEFTPKGLVRVGGRSKSTVLSPFNLVELRRQQRVRRTLPKHIHENRKNVFDHLQQLKKTININLDVMRTSERQLLNEYALATFMSKKHHDQLCLIDEMRLANSDISVVAEWLGLIENTSLTELDDAGIDDDGDNEDNYGDLYALGKNHVMYRSSELLQHGDDEEFQRRMMDFDFHEYDDLERRGYEEQRLQADLSAIKAKLLVQLSEKSSNGWMKQGGLKKMKTVIFRQLRSTDIMGPREAKEISDIWVLSLANRWRLYRFWLGNLRQISMDSVRGLLQEYSDAQLQLKEINLERDVGILRNTRVIGMTTTGAARNRELLKIIAPAVVIVEEAAEVLESHVVTSLTKDCQHIILIGDQQQLKPNPSSYALAQNCNLDVSLFERLINNNIVYQQLTLQHRMRPSISRLLVPHIYKNLRDHKSVMTREEVRGMPSSVFFLNHDRKESVAKGTTSFANAFEAEFVLSLYRHLLKQDYKPDQITILTTYGAQVKLIKEMATDLQMGEVDCCSVDGFQGKENEIILLSLVRSNTNSHVGFLKVPNRICVALSRARIGLYCIGNLKDLSKFKKTIWPPIVSSLIRDSQIESHIRIACPNHPTQVTVIKEAEDFKNIPEGGCLRPCNAVLSCGHPCPIKCHGYDRDHLTIKCRQPCQKLICDSHNIKCQNRCGEDCGACLLDLEKYYQSCGHRNVIMCYQDPKHVPCQQRCKNHLRTCGHQCGGRCGHAQLCKQLKCLETIDVESPCGHVVEMVCRDARNASLVKSSCKSKCQTLLPCGHTCEGTCAACKNGTKHVLCKQCPRIKKR